ncbi:MAG TPA: hypothetical protein VHP38_14185 [Ruminiclostridium sp.]|nr:hypothetical protein [Ruminiclostridium sp.]
MKEIIRLYERNDYYTGKLLSAKDFKAEQQYFNDKRSLLNIFTLGSGILYGLDVIKTGDSRQEESISIKPGVAVDAWGREIVVPEIDTKVLSEMDGFPEEEYNGAMYLCLEYNEKGIAEASAIDDSEDGSNVRRYNRIQETYRLVLRKKPPEAVPGIESLFCNVVTLYEDDRVILYHKSPKYTNAGQVFECSFILVKLRKNIQVGLDYEVSAEGLNTLSRSVQFESPDRSEETETEITYFLEGKNGDGSITFNSQSLRLKIGDDTAAIKPARITLQSETEPVTERLIKEYYGENLKERLESIEKDRIYLAKIFILQVKNVLGTKYHIEQVESTLYARYIYPGYLQKYLSQSLKAPAFVKEIQQDGNDVEKEPELSGESLRQSNTGILRIPAKEAYKRTYYSEEIEHGLGAGQVFVSVGLEERNSSLTAKAIDKDEAVFLGNMELFQKSEFAPDCNSVAAGIVMYPRKGTFRVGASVQCVDSEKEWVTLRWWAVRCESTELLV